MIFGATRLWIAPQFSGKFRNLLGSEQSLSIHNGQQNERGAGSNPTVWRDPTWAANRSLLHPQKKKNEYIYIYIYIVWVNTLAPGNTTAIASWNQKSTGFVTRISRPPDFWALQNPSKSHGTRSPIINSHQTLHLWYHIIIIIYTYIIMYVWLCMYAPFGPSVDSLSHSWFTTTKLSYRSYRFPILKLPPAPCAVLVTIDWLIIDSTTKQATSPCTAPSALRQVAIDHFQAWHLPKHLVQCVDPTLALHIGGLG